MKLGDAAQITRRFSTDDVASYVALGGADIDGAVPEPMIGALFSYLLGMRLPGPGTNYLKQSYEFVRSAQVGSTLTASVKVTRIRSEKAIVDFETICTDENNNIICTGRALVRVTDVIKD